MDRLFAALFAGLVAYMAALSAGIPSWRHLPIGDATDFGVCTGFAVWFAIGALNAKAIEARRAATTGAVEDESAARVSGFAQPKPYSETD